jgi:signal peptidase II
VTPRRAFAAALVAAWAIDVVTKVWAAAGLSERTIGLLDGRLLLRESRNTGAAFSIGTDQTMLISLFGVVIVAIIVRHVRTVTSRAAAAAWGLVAGGATGNLTDRLLRDPAPLRGGVVDWIDLGWFPSFNAADSAITVGVALLLLVTFREERASSA